MDGIRNFWKSGLIGKIVLVGAAALGLFSICCVALVILAMSRPRSSASAVTDVPSAPPVVEVEAATSIPELTAFPTEIPKPTSVPTAAASPTPAPTVTPAPPTEVPSLAQQVRTAVEAVLSSSNRKVERITTAVADPDQKSPQIFIRWTINDNLTKSMIKSSARHDAVKILKAIAGLGVDYSAVLIEGTFPLVDKLGNTKESIVVHAMYPKATLDKVNWPNFLSDNVYVIADEVTIHPAFREE